MLFITSNHYIIPSIIHTLPAGRDRRAAGDPRSERRHRRRYAGDCVPKLRGCVGSGRLAQRPGGARPAQHREDELRGEWWRVCGVI